ncbi:MAG: methyltransferase [Desulfovibrionaceae bacterium]
MSNGQRDIRGPEDISAIAGAYQRCRVLLTAFELGVFTAIGGAALSARKVAERIGADARATERLLCALHVMGLVVREGGLFRNTAVSARCLCQGGDLYMSGLGHMARQYERWATLTPAVRAGGAVVPQGRDDDQGREAFIAAMHARALETADALVARIGMDGVARVLDVGGGSGVYAMAMCRAASRVRATVFDLPQVTPLTRRYVAAGGFEARIGIVEGDYREAAFGEGFDLVFLSAIAHINSPEVNRSLLRRAYAALVPGGRIVVQDFIMDADRMRPAMGVFFALNMLVSTDAGDAYTEAEIRGWLEDAGCVGVERVETGPNTTMLIGHKA